jgi:N-methylhydantoinase A
MSMQRLVDMRYLGQWRSLTIPVSAPADLGEAVARFHAEHERAYNYRRDGSPVEIYRLSVRAVGVTPKPQLKRHELNGAGAKPRGTRPVHFDASGTPLDTPLYVRDDLAAGARLEGPAVVDQLDSTTVVPPGWRAEVDEWLNIRMHRDDDGGDGR